MPEHPEPKSYTPLDDVPQLVPAPEAYAELDVATNFSFLRGASHPDELVYRAAELGYRALAITDRNSLAGVVRAHEAAKKCGLPLLIGARLVLQDAPDILIWCADRPAYARLCRLLTTGKRRADKGQCALWFADLLSAMEDQPGLLAAVVPPEPLDPHVEDVLAKLREVGGKDDRISLATSCLHHGVDGSRMRDLQGLSRAFDVPLLATNGVHYHHPGRRPLQDVLTCIRHGCTIQEAGYRLFPNGERYLKTPALMHHLFKNLPDALQRSVEIAERCTFSLDELKYEYPDELVPPGKSASEFLRELTEEGARQRYPEGTPPKVGKQIEHELKLIAQLKYEAYFLTVYDLVKFARSRGILCQGRGSAANSAVCYCIGVTSVDPNKIDLLFERFVSAARKEPPDIDVDFEHERREEVLQYLFQKYGRQRAGMTAEVISYRGRSAVRDVGKALGLSLDLVDQMAKQLDGWNAGTVSDQQLRALGLDPEDRTIKLVVGLTSQLLGFPRHLSQHVGGMIMTRCPLCEMVPVENATMQDRTVIEWDKDDIDAVGMLKVDVLALGMLTCISKAFKFIETERRRDRETKWIGADRTDIEVDDGEGSNVSRIDRLATSDGFGESGVQSNARDTEGRAIWSYESDASGGGVNPLEYRRGIRETESGRSDTIPSNSAGLAKRVGDPTGVGEGTQLPIDTEGTNGSALRNGSSATSADPQSRAKELTSHSVSSSLCLFVSNPPRLELHTIPQDDPGVYDMICRADTIGVFQIESRAQMSMLPRLRPRKFYDLVIEVAIVRPGPIQGNMVHPYLRRRNGEDPISYPNEQLRDVLQCTLGVPLFQEQAMKVAMVAAGFTADEADLLRRAMAAWRKSGAIEKFRPKLINGMLKNGYDRAFAEQCFEQIRGFGEYGFPESHAAAFASLVYVSAWIKRYHPAAFAAALLNSQPMGFYAPAQIVRDAQDHGVTVRAVDVNQSEWDCTLEGSDEGKEGMSDEATKRRSDEGEENHATSSPSSLRRSIASSLIECSVAPSLLSPDPSTWGHGGPALRLGLRIVKGLRQAQMELLVAERRQRGTYRSIADLQLRTALPKSTLKRLAEADAFGSLGLSRREALWKVLGLEEEAAPLFDGIGRDKETERRRDEVQSSAPTTSLRLSVSSSLPDSGLPAMPRGLEVLTDYTTVGLSLKDHPVALVREALRARKVLPAARIQDIQPGRWVRVAGLVLIRQRPGTASGIVFETLEDETGIVNLIIRPHIYERYRQAARFATLVEAQGIVERQGDVIHVMVKKLEDLTPLVEGLRTSSRDFH